MPNNPYAVETRAQGVLLLAESREVADVLRHEALALGLEPLVLGVEGEGSSEDRLNTYLADHDLDYVVAVMTPGLQTWVAQEGRGVWENVLNLSGAGNVVVALAQDGDVSIELPQHVRLVRLGEYLDVLGAPTLNELISDAHARGSITLPGDGVVEYSLLSLSDLGSALMHAVTSPAWHSHELIVANPETISLLALAHTIVGSMTKHVKITFSEQEGRATPDYNWKKIILDHAKYGIVISGDVQESLVKYVRDFKPREQTSTPVHETHQPVVTRLTPLPKPEVIRERPVPIKAVVPKKSADPSLMFVPLAASSRLGSLKSKLQVWKKPPHAPRTTHPLRNSLLRGLALAGALYLGSLAFVGTIVGLHLRSLSHLEAADITQLKVSPLTKYAATYLEANLVTLASLPPFTNNAMLREATHLMDLYTQGLGLLETAEELSGAAKNISSYILTDKGGDIASYFSAARLYTEELYQKTSLLDGAMNPVAPDLISHRAKEYGEVKATLGLLKKNLITGKALLAVAPDFIALGTRTKYAVLFQNNMELRATGGFIGSFAILSFENGHLYDMPVYDVYAADGQLKGHVEPPAPIKDILGEANWYLRDSNFDPDFPTSARRAEWFIKKTMNEDVSGTIGITLDVLKSLLHATGPLELSDYGETVSESNIYERAQFHAEVNFFPGSQAKKEFLSSVADALFAKIQSGGTQDTLKLISALASAMESKNIVISSLDPGIEHVMSTLSWNGQLVEHPCPGGGTCVQDYAYLVDSNFGVNKANYYVSRTFNLVATASKDGVLAHVFSAKYKNTATSSAWPAGAYKNYARLYLPFGSQLESIKVGDKVLASSELTQSEEHGKLVVAFLMTVPINSELEVEARYTTPQALKPGSLYTWYWQKQPGTNVEEPLSVTLNYPLYLKPEIISPKAELNPQSLFFGFENDADHRVTVKFAQ